MNKELEALENLLSFAFVMSENMVGLTKGHYDEKIFVKKTYEYLNKYIGNFECRDILKSALQRLEEIDNSNPSEALECLLLETLLERANHDELLFRKDKEYCEKFLEENKKYYDTIKQSLIRAQKQEKENTRYKQLEEQLGCPLEVIEQLFKQDFIYFKYPANIQIMKVKVCKGLSYGTNLGWHVTCIYDNIDFEYISLKDYKKTWWLKEDRSE